MNDTEDRLRQLLIQAPPDLGGIDPDTLLASRAAQGRATRPRLVATAASVAAVAAVAVTLSMLGNNSGAGDRRPGSQAATDHAPVDTFADIPASVFDAAGAPEQLEGVTKLHESALTAGGKPEVLHIGADWAPYDAAERWALAAALSRFGTLSGLGLTASKADDIDPNTATISFEGASYTSGYVSGVFKDIEDSNMKPLDKLTPSEEQLFSAGGESMPFIDVAGRYRVMTQYDPAILKGLSQAQIADALTDPSSPVAKAALGAANVLTAAICEATGNQPAAVCSSDAVTVAKRLLDAAPNEPANTKGTK